MALYIIAIQPLSFLDMTRREEVGGKGSVTLVFFKGTYSVCAQKLGIQTTRMGYSILQMPYKGSFISVRCRGTFAYPVIIGEARVPRFLTSSAVETSSRGFQARRERLRSKPATRISEQFCTSR